MKYRQVGQTGLKVSEYCLGCQAFGDQVDENESIRMVHMALDCGVNFFDVANVYNGGLSEIILGKALKGKRESAIIATKVYGQMGEGVNDRGLSRKHILEAVEGSLKRLNVDYIDIYQMHAPDYETSIEETLIAMEYLVSKGKVRYIGCSNFSAWQICKALWISETKKVAKIASVQAMYNILSRRAEQELLPFCYFENVGVFVYNPLAGGLLTGKYLEKEKIQEGTRFTKKTSFGKDTYRNRYWNKENLCAIKEISNIAAIAGVDMVKIALGWLLSNQTVTSVIVGASSISQFTHNINSLGWQPSPEEIEIFDKLWVKLRGVAPHYNRLHYHSKYLGQVGPE